MRKEKVSFERTTVLRTPAELEALDDTRVLEEILPPEALVDIGRITIVASFEPARPGRYRPGGDRRYGKRGVSR